MVPDVLNAQINIIKMMTGIQNASLVQDTPHQQLIEIRAMTHTENIIPHWINGLRVLL